MGLGLRRRFEAAAGFPPLKRLLTAAHFACADRSSGSGRHPLDVAYGVRTQGAMPLYLNRTGSAADQDMIPYAGCVPSVLRRVLDTLPGLRHASFLDLGCGKGRALVIASEYPFAALFGVELNAALVTVARRNLDRVRLRHPDRPPVEVRCGDASRSHLPEGDLVVFLYHPFGERLVQTLCDHLLATATGAVHLVYETRCMARCSIAVRASSAGPPPCSTTAKRSWGTASTPSKAWSCGALRARRRLPRSWTPSAPSGSPSRAFAPSWSDAGASAHPRIGRSAFRPLRPR